MAAVRKGFHTVETANLRRAKMCAGTTLLTANLRGAGVSEVETPGAEISHANPIEAALSGARFPGARLVESDLMGAGLSGADLTEADLRRVRLHRG